MSRRFQFSLKMLLAAAIAVCVIAKLGQIFARDMAGGRISDLPIADKQALDAITAQGIAVVDHFT